MTFPSDLASDGSLLIAANNVASTLNGGVSSGATSMTLASTTHFPSKGGVTVESEAILYTSNNTATAVLSGITRGADSTTAAVHADGTAAYGNMQARHHNALKDEVIGIETYLNARFGITGNINVPSGVQVSIQSSNGLAATGTPTNDNANAGQIGEYLESIITAATNVPATGVWGDLTSLSLTAGDWDVSGKVNFYLNSATCTDVAMGLKATSGNSAPTEANAGYSVPPTTAAPVSPSIPRLRVSQAAGSTMYLKYFATYSAGTPQARGIICARRVR